MKPEVIDRLRTCFLDIFPDVDPRDVEAASNSTVGAWDSLNSIKLLEAIEEEFKIQFDLQDILLFTSFSLVRDCTMKKIAGVDTPFVSRAGI